MMNFKCIGNIGLKLTTVLASMVVSFTGGTVICSPIYTVIRFISAFPCWGFIAHNVCGLPFPHALCGAKVMLRNVCVLTAEILSTPVAMNYLASPPEGSRRAGTRTGNSASPFPTQTICSHRESLSTYLTGQLLSGGMKFVVNLLAIVRTKPKAGRVSFYQTIRSGYLFAALVTIKYHAVIIHTIIKKSMFIAPEQRLFSTLIAAEQTGRTAFLMEIDCLYADVCVKRWEDYSGEKATLEER